MNCEVMRSAYKQELKSPQMRENGKKNQKWQKREVKDMKYAASIYVT